MATILNNGINWGINLPINTQYADSSNIDAFSRVRVSNPQTIFNAQLTYDLQPILFEQITNGAGATIVHDSTNRCALMTFSSTPTGGKSYMQTYEYYQYQPGKSQAIFITFNMIAGVSNVLKFAGYSDGVNGIEFQLSGTTKQFAVLSASTAGNETVTQSSWNLDKLDGTGASGITLDITKTQILVIDFQALYVGRVRIGFDINGTVVYAHEFLHANLIAYPYIQSANLPIRCGMTCTGTVSTTMNYICSSVISEGGQEDVQHYTFSTQKSVTAGSGTRTYMMSIRPKLTFNSITNRVGFHPISLDVLVTGNNPVYWELCIGQAITTPTYADVNATYSAFEVDSAGTLSGSPAIVLSSGYVPASATVKSTISTEVNLRYPISLNQAGAHRDNGTLTLLVTGIGGTSACRAALTFAEHR